MALTKEKFLDALKKVREDKKRNFSQSIELIVNLKEFDTKKDKLEEFVVLPAGRGVAAKVCAFVGPELKDAAEKNCDNFVLSDNFDKLSKREIRRLARNNDFFIAQANVMPAVAKFFGRFLSPIGKMPNPAAGHVVPPKANIEPLIKNLKLTTRVSVKKAPVIQTLLGNDKMSDEDLAKNFQAVIERAISKLPKGEHNIKNVIIKTSMGKPVRVI